MSPEIAGYARERLLEEGALDVTLTPIEQPGNGTVERLLVKAKTTIQRSDFGIDFNAPLGADGMLIGDKVDIELEIQIVPA